MRRSFLLFMSSKDDDTDLADSLLDVFPRKTVTNQAYVSQFGEKKKDELT